MINQGSSRYDIQKYQKLINDCVNLGSTELGNLVLTGEDLLDLAEAIGNIEDYSVEYDDLTEEYKKLKENYQNTIDSLEKIFKGKEGSLVTIVMDLVKEAKENMEEEE